MIATTRSPGTLADDAGVGTVAWSSPGNAAASDDSRAATGSMGSSDVSHYLKCTGFGFSIPSDHDVLGIELAVEWRDTSWGARQNRLRIVKAGVIGSDTAHDASTNLPDSDTVERFGGDFDLWGETWTASDVNDAGFGVAISCKGPTLFSGTAEIDHVQLTLLHGKRSTASRLLTGIG